MGRLVIGMMSGIEIRRGIERDGLPEKFLVDMGVIERGKRERGKIGIGNGGVIEIVRGRGIREIERRIKIKIRERRSEIGNGRKRKRRRKKKRRGLAWNQPDQSGRETMTHLVGLTQ
jgi:hypothetical protein